MICWYCYWGWPQEVKAIHDRGVERCGGDDSAMHFGPAHVVWEDENFDFVESSLEDFDAWVRDWNDDRFSPEDLEVVRDSLKEMMALPESIRDPEPEDYDDENPSLYPPPEGMVMVK